MKAVSHLPGEGARAVHGRLAVLTLMPVLAIAAAACGHRFGPGPFPTVLASDSFSNPSAGILPHSCTGQSDLAGIPFQCAYVNGEYQLAVDQSTNQGLALVDIPGSYAAAPGGANTTIDVDVRLVSADGGVVGVRCRRVFHGPAGIQAYEFLIAPSSGNFALSRYDPAAGDTSTTFVPLVPLQPSAAIHRGAASNHLQLTCNGGAITASINGTQVASVQDHTYQSGWAELVTASSRSGPPGTLDARFSNLIVIRP